jgi:hypothetical protein
MEFKFGDRIIVDFEESFHNGLEGNIIDSEYVFLGAIKDNFLDYYNYIVRLDTPYGKVDVSLHEAHIRKAVQGRIK